MALAPPIVHRHLSPVTELRQLPVNGLWRIAHASFLCHAPQPCPMGTVWVFGTCPTTFDPDVSTASQSDTGGDLVYIYVQVTELGSRSQKCDAVPLRGINGQGLRLRSNEWREFDSRGSPQIHSILVFAPPLHTVTGLLSFPATGS